MKKEKGAITLFVLVACLFFVFVLGGGNIFTLNKIHTQEQNLKQIQENYARDITRIDEIYQEMTN